MDGKSGGTSRREFVKLVGSGLATVYLGGCASFFKKTGDSSQTEWMARVGPFDRTLVDLAPEVFTGDRPERPHSVLWDKKKFLKAHGGVLPAPTESAEIVVVGGGMSGLISSYLLGDKDILLLEQADRFGGNSKGESWRGLDYSLSTAYFNVPQKGSVLESFIREIGMDQRVRIVTGSDPVFIDGVRYENIWENGTIPESREQFRLLGKHFADILHEREGHIFPRIPIPEGPSTAASRAELMVRDPATHEWIRKLDRMTFKEYVLKVLGKPIHPHVEQVIEQYFWSSFASSYTETSAAGGLNFFSADFEDVAVAPGGNAALAEAVLEKLSKKVNPSRLRPSSLVFHVEVKTDGVYTTYLTSQQELKTVKSGKVILSCPKFVVARILDGIEPQRLAAIRAQKYRSYLVANVLLDTAVKDSFYDLYFINNGMKNITDVKKDADTQGGTDLVYGNYAKPDPAHTVLTLFRAFPYEHAREEIYRPTAYAKFKKEFKDQVESSVLPLMGIPTKNLVDIRMARWGHPLPLFQVGNYRSGKIDWMRKPFRDCVYFVEQDNWTLPCFETAFHEAKYWTDRMKERV